MQDEEMSSEPDGGAPEGVRSSVVTADPVPGPMVAPAPRNASAPGREGTGGEGGSAGRASGRPGAAKTRPASSDPAAVAWALPLLVLIIGMFMSILDTTIVNIAITNIRKDFGSPIEDAQWIATAYGLTEGAVVPISAWLGNRVGHKKLYIWSVALFTVFSLFCGTSSSLNEMIAFRVLQAIPGGMIPVTCLTLIYRMVPPGKIGAAMGMYGLGVTLAPGLGPALGGYLVEYVSWPWIYWVNIPIGIGAVIAAIMVLPDFPGRRGSPLDKGGFLCIFVGLFVLLLALEKGGTWGWDSYPVLGLFAVGINLLALWVIIQQQAEHPMLDLRAFRSVTFVKSLVLIGLVFAGMFAMLFNMPQFLQNVQGKTPWQTGLITLPYAMCLMVMMPLAGRLYDSVGPRWPSVIGLSVLGCGLLMLVGVSNPDAPVGGVVLAQCVVGVGLGLAMMPIMTGGLSAVPPALNDSAGALNTLSQRVSQAFSTALLTAMINSDRAQFFVDRSSLIDGGANGNPAVKQMAQQGPEGLLGLWQQVSNHAQTDAYANAFLLTAVLVFVGVLLAFTLPSGRPVTDGQQPVAH
jgi:EmrB/QacA subfamily drug resistance transporter